MNAKRTSATIVAILLILVVQSQELKNTSHRNQTGEKVLRFEFTLPIGMAKAWQLFTKDEKLKKWIAP